MADPVRNLGSGPKLLLGPVLLRLAIQALLDTPLVLITAGALLPLRDLLFLLLMVMHLLLPRRGGARVVGRGVRGWGSYLRRVTAFRFGVGIGGGVWVSGGGPL